MVVRNRIVRSCAAAIVIAAIPMLAACGDNSDTSAPATADVGSFGAAATKSDAAAKVDVCSLLHPQDAYAVADSAKLAGGKAAGTAYKLSATKVDYDPANQEISPRSGCKFVFDATSSDGTTSNAGVVVIETTPAEDFDLYAGNGQPIPGLGDAAVDSAGTTYVKVGDVMLQAGEDSFDNDFVTDLYRKMVPNLK